MNISLNWVKEFVDLPKIDTDDLANSFTMTTAEVEGVSKTFDHLSKIVVAKITEIKKHPEADKLNLVTFDYGAGHKEVVCGAPNVRVGLKVPYAPLGVTLPNGLTLEPKKIRGYLSEGMLCSQVELGIGEGASGLMEIADDVDTGISMLSLLNVEADTILDVDNKSLTHRPDLWGHLGIAREFAAAYDLKLNNPYDKNWEESLESKFNELNSPVVPKVDSNSSCKAYWGLSVDSIKVEKSPDWIVSRIEAAGMRSINSIVDISNYVMLELGVPLHIFDRSKIKDNQIKIQKLESEENFITLDEVERKLLKSDTVICDSEKTLVLAGIMGGLSSSVSEDTSEIFIEVANWVAEDVRQTSTRLGLRTDSSQRYEKSLDSQQCYKTLLRTLELILELNPDAKVIGKPQYDGENLSLFKPKMINTSFKNISNVLGHNVPNDKILAIFNSLEFSTKVEGDNITVTLPSFRTTKDIEYEACLVEEIGRMIGYDNINPVSPTSGIETTRFHPAKSMHRKIQDFLVFNARALEVMTYPLLGKKLLDKANWNNFNENLVLVNSLSKDADRMRPSMIPHSLNTVAVNSKNYDKFNFFELGRSYYSSSKNFSEERTQLLVGSFDKHESPIIKLINDIENLLTNLNIPFELVGDSDKYKNHLILNDWIGKHPHEYLNIKIMGKFNGVINTVHPLVLKSFKTKGFYSFCVIDLTEFHNREMKSKDKYTPISKYPSSSFDCTVLVPSSSPAASALDVLNKVKIKEMKSKKVVDVYNLNEEFNAVTLKVVFEDPSKTLESNIIKDAEKLIVQTLEDAGFSLKV